MNETRYLKWYNKIGYGTGDIAGNTVYAFLTAFVMIYLTNGIGLNPGIVGTLMAVSKLFDGVSDVFIGALIDKTHSKMGKARPWMFYGYFGCAVALIAIFAIPTSMGTFAQYAWFFIFYTLLNAVFYTANNLAYSTLTALITKNSAEQVEMGTYRFVFAIATSLVVQSVTLGAVTSLGGGAEAWRTMAIIYAVVGIIFNTIAVFSVRELPENELVSNETKSSEVTEKVSFLESIKLLLSNKYFIIVLCVHLISNISSAMLGMGTYYATYVLGDENIYGTFSIALTLPAIVALLFTPVLVAKMHGMYRLNLISAIIAFVSRSLLMVSGFMRNIPLMLLFMALSSLAGGPWQGDMNAIIAACSENTWLKKQKRIDGMMFSCTSVGTKVGSGLGTAVAGWLLAFSKFDSALEIQPDSCLNMLNIMYLIIPVVLSILTAVLMSRLKVEQENAQLIAQN